MGLLTSFNKTNLDVENSGPSGFFNKDTTTNFSALTTGTPTDTANPGPTKRFIQKYLPFTTYLNDVPVGGEGKLLYTLSSTNLDVEDERPNGGIPYKQDKDPTQYPFFSTGIPNDSIPFLAANKFFQQYSPQNLYVFSRHPLQDSLSRTSLDVEDERPDGGLPYKTYKDPTEYPWYVTGAPTADFSPGPANKFFQTYDPYNDYLYNIPINGDGILRTNYTNSSLKSQLNFQDTVTIYPWYTTQNSVGSSGGGGGGRLRQKYDSVESYLFSHPLYLRPTDLIPQIFVTSQLDLEYGFAYFPSLDPTVYPKYVTGTPNIKSNPGPFHSFDHIYTPEKVYLDNIPNDGEGALRYTTVTSNLDVEDGTPNGGNPYKLDRDPTEYPIWSTGIPSIDSPFTAASKFEPQYDPGYIYLTYINEYKSYLKNSLKQTSLDVSDERPDGGIPYKIDKDPTEYPIYTTGVPTLKANPGVSNKFNQVYTPENVYLSKNPIGGKGRLVSTIAYTPLYIENSSTTEGSPYGPYKADKDPTAYPKYTTGVPTTEASPGPFNKFNQIYTPGKVYLDNIPNDGEGKLISTTANSNLDVEDETPNGGLPYKIDKDPTIYPETTTGTPEFAVNPAAPSRFDPQFNPAQTYLDYIRSIYDRSRSHLLHLGKEGGAHYSIFTATNLDIEDEFPNGGIPYVADLTDFTVYPITAKKKSSVKGWNVVEGLSATKYQQLWTPNSTYLNFIG
jgi:hypothetical protein